MGTSPEENEAMEPFRKGGLLYRKHAVSLEAAGHHDLAAEARGIAEQSDFYVMLVESDLYREDARNHLIAGQIKERADALNAALDKMGGVPQAKRFQVHGHVTYPFTAEVDARDEDVVMGNGWEADDFDDLDVDTSEGVFEIAICDQIEGDDEVEDDEDD